MEKEIYGDNSRSLPQEGRTALMLIIRDHFGERFHSSFKEKTNSLGNRYLKRIDGVDRKVLLERGLQSQAVLIVEDETLLFRRILKRLLILFEMEFYTSLGTSEELIDSDLYQNFVEVINTYFAFV